MADPKEQTPVVPDDVPRERPGLEPHVRKAVIFLSLAVLILAFSVWMLALVPKPVGGFFALLGGVFAFAAFLHSMRKS